MSGDSKSGIYWGRIMHHRFSPKRHYFTYPVFIFAIDLDEIETWNKKLWLLGHNKFSLYTLRDSDHAAPGSAIKQSIIQLLRDRGYDGPVDQIVMVTQFRVLGYLFNPVTFYYCYANGEEVAYVAEVNNTFHQRHSYVFFDEENSSRNSFKNSFEVDKVFYVSPFLEMDVAYRYRFESLGADLRVFIDDFRVDENKVEQPVLKTHIVGKYHPLSDWNLLKSFLKIPFMSVWIIAWIHWQALKLWLKRVPLAFRPHDGMEPGWVQTTVQPVVQKELNANARAEVNTSLEQA